MTTRSPLCTKARNPYDKSYLRKLINILLIVLSVVVFSCADDEPRPRWKVLDTKSLDVVSIDFLDDDYGVATVAIGHVLMTTDGGSSWHQKSLTTNGNFMSCFILDKQNVFVGKHNVFKSEDGGENFTELGKGEMGDASSVFGIHFFDADTGIALKAWAIFKTYDGGENWVLKPSDASGASIVEYAGNKTVYVGGGSTYDGYSYGVLNKTADAGESWQSVNLPVEIQNSEIMAIDFLSPDVGFVATFDDHIFMTEDGGESWRKIVQFADRSINGMVFIDANTGYITSDKKIYKTRNNGQDWSLDFEADDELFYIEKTENNLYVVGRDGVIIKHG